MAHALEDGYVNHQPLLDTIQRFFECEESRLVSELWLEATWPYKSSESTLRKLADKGVFHPDLLKLPHMHINPERTLYTHQHKAIITEYKSRHEAVQPTMLITAGTGSGKTEAFLLPMLNRLVSISRAKGSNGVRAIIIYPTNALIFDQVNRLDDWLKNNQLGLSFAYFTSDTPEDDDDADVKSIEHFGEYRRRTRTDIRDCPPDILITNYSMLEFILARPKDSSLLDKALECLVLDEAHQYLGGMATEMAMMLKRICYSSGMGATSILHILASATLGGDGNEQTKFAAMFTDKPASAVRLIKGEDADVLEPFETVESWPIEQLKMVEPYEPRPTFEHGNLVDCPDECARLREKLRVLAPGYEFKSETQPARQLYDILTHSPYARWLVDSLKQNRIGKLSEISTDKRLLWLLNLGASARQKADHKPLIPHRLHALVSQIETLYVCLSGQCTASIKAEPFGGLFDKESSNCPYCLHDKVAELWHCQSCGTPVLRITAPMGDQLITPVDWYQALDDHDDTGLIPGAKRQVDRSPQRGVVTGAKCARCGKSRHIGPLYTHHITDSLVVETVIQHIPPMPGVDESTLPAGGRRLLAFSDSRRKAAILGPTLTHQHNSLLFKHWLLSQGCSKLTINDQLRYKRYTTKEQAGLLEPDEREELDDICAKLNHAIVVKELMRHAGSDWHAAQIFDPWIQGRVHYEEPGEWDDGDYMRTRWREVAKQDIYKLFCEEFHTAKPGANSLETQGLLEVEYPGLERLECPDVFNGCSANVTEAYSDILAVILDTLRLGEFYRCSIPNEPFTKDVDDDMHFSTKEEDWSLNREAFVGKGKNSRFLFLNRVLTTLDIERSDGEIKAFLESIYDHLSKTRIPAISVDRSGISINMSELRLMRPEQLWYDNITGRVSSRRLMNLISDTYDQDDDEFDGDLRDGQVTRYCEPITQQEADCKPRLRRLRTELTKPDGPFSMGLWGEEHSAQLSVETTSKIQKLFLRGARNVLSCTTTMELGVDIGGLNVVYNSNVPPVKASYLQRAGRAGRRADGSSLVVTKIGNNPFDLGVRDNFGVYLGQDMPIPMVDMSRQKIIRRHRHALLYSEFCHSYSGDWITKIGKFMGMAQPAKKVSDNLDISRLRNYINEFIDFIKMKGAGIISEITSSSWDSYAGSDVDSIIKTAIKCLVEIKEGWISEFYECIKARDMVTGREKSFWYWQCNALWNEQVINVLSGKQFLPRYGFAVDVRRLWEGDAKDPQAFRLERSSIEALGEYSPGREVPVGWQKKVSRGVMKSWIDNGKTAIGKQYSLTVHHDRSVSISELSTNKIKLEAGSIRFTCLDPRFGYVTRRSAKTQAIRKDDWFTPVGRFAMMPSDSQDWKIDGQLQHACAEGQNVFALNMGRSVDVDDGSYGVYGYAICTRCGHAQAETGYGDGTSLPNGFKKHYSVLENRAVGCMGDTDTPMRNRVLIATLPTDIVFYEYPGLNQLKADTMGQALRLAGAKMLNVDFRQLMFLTYPAQRTDSNVGLAMFDNVAGGQSMVIDLHVRREEWFDKAVEQLEGSPDHDKLCLKSCIRCLITRDQSMTVFDRKAALEAFAAIRENRTIGGAIEPEPGDDLFGDVPPAPKKRKK